MQSYQPSSVFSRYSWHHQACDSVRAEIEREIQKAGRRLATNYAAKGPSKKVRSMIMSGQDEFCKVHLQRGGGASFFYIFYNFSRKITSWLQRVYRVSCHIIICDPAVCDTIIPTIASIKPIVDFLSRFKQNFANPILQMTMILVADSSCILQAKQRIPFFSKYFMETCAYWVCSAP